MAITLRAARVNKDLTQEQAAKLIGITADTLRNYERAKSFPDVPIIKKIEDVYGVEYKDLVFFPSDTV